MKRIRIAMMPAWRNRRQQPYNSHLAEGLIRRGFDVVEASPDFLMRPWRFDILHLHWPEYEFSGRRAILRGPFLLLCVVIMRLRGGRLVQTVHNVKPHGSYGQRTLFALGVIDRLTSSILVHDARRVDEIFAARPALRKALVVEATFPVVALNRDPELRRRVREAWGVGSEQVAFLHFGLLREYKGTPELLEAWRHRPSGTTLVCAGQPDEAVRRAVSVSSSQDGLVFDLRILPEVELEAYLLGADVAILPYRQVTTSASIWSALGAGLPVVMPKSRTAEQAQDLVGEDWILIYSGDLDGEVLANARDLVTRPRQPLPPLPTFDDLAAVTAHLYDQTIEHG